ncbi:MAG: DUF2079 domain-containing protein [Actinomycetota bacterium]|nr:DUF2079 domain-containing protein [Actinomycetota bacterium]
MAPARRWGAVAVAVQAVVIIPFALLRYVDGDEGPYLTAAKLVMKGRLPYRDFLYTQMPLLPYVWGPWSVVTGESWYAARLLAAALAIGTGALLYVHLARRVGPRLAAVGGVVFAFSTLVFVWLTPVKTQVLSTLLLFAAYVVASNARRQPVRWFVAGVLLGLALDTRLILAAAVPAFAWVAARAGQRMAAALAGGLAIGLVPSFVFLAIDPARFVFGNLGYHASRSEGGLVGDFGQKAHVVENLLGIGTPDGGVPQFLLLAIAATVLLVALRRTSFALGVAALVCLGSLFPTPTYVQYFAVAVPFLVVGAVELIDELRRRQAGGAAARSALAVAVVAYVVLGLPDLVRYPRLSPDERIGTVERAGAIVDEHTRPGEAVLAPWPGYLYGTHALPAPGLENDFAPHEAAALTPTEARRYRLATAAEIERRLAAGETRIVVFRLWNRFPPVPDWEGGLRRGGYRVIATVDTTKIYAR